jgi:uncharacterized protein
MALYSGLLGGAMIGGAAGSLLILSGEILGASGIVSSVLLNPLKILTDQSQQWKLVFLSSFLLTATFALAPMFDHDNSPALHLSPIAYGLAGLFVGFGTKLGNGCTSGHGICGLARLSKRSLAAVCTFMASAISTALVTSPSRGWRGLFSFLRAEPVAVESLSGFASALALSSILVLAFAPRLCQKKDENGCAKRAPAAFSGALFAAGLLVSQMVYQSRVLNFLNLAGISSGTWDLTLIMAMVGGMGVSMISYQFIANFRIIKRVKPLAHPIALKPGSKFAVPTSTLIDAPLIVGALSFGIGWGLAGICPGPAIFLAAVGTQNVILVRWPSFFVGCHVANAISYLSPCRCNA